MFTGFFVMFNKSYSFISKDKDISKCILVTHFEHGGGVKIKVDIYTTEKDSKDIVFNIPIKDVPELISRLEKAYKNASEAF